MYASQPAHSPNHHCRAELHVEVSEDPQNNLKVYEADLSYALRQKWQYMYDFVSCAMESYRAPPTNNFH